MSSPAARSRSRGAKIEVIWGGGPRRYGMLLLSVLCFAGCATFRAYEGPARPSRAVAIVHGDAKLRARMPLALVIRAVDDRPVDLRYSSVALLPGQHQVLVDCQLGDQLGAASRHRVEVDAVAGARYRLRAEMRSGNRSCERVLADQM
jgi:hypothetical protein